MVQQTMDKYGEEIYLEVFDKFKHFEIYFEEKEMIFFSHYIFKVF